MGRFILPAGSSAVSISNGDVAKSLLRTSCLLPAVIVVSRVIQAYMSFRGKPSALSTRSREQWSSSNIFEYRKALKHIGLHGG